MSYEGDRRDFIADMRDEGVPGDVSRSILRDAQRLHTIAEHQCGDGKGSGPYGEPTEEELTRWERSEEAAEKRIGQRLAPYEIAAHFQGDPRGAVVKLRLPSGRHNDFGGEGLYCVPTR